MDDRAARGWVRYSGALTWAALFSLTLWSFWVRYQILGASPYPLGVDGYFYPIQLRSLLDHGSLYYTSSPLAIWFMAPLAALTDPITGAKLGAALGTALAVIPMYLLGRRIGGSRGAGFLSATLVASSPSSMYLGTEFVKQGIGLTALAWYLCALAWALDGMSARPQDTGSGPAPTQGRGRCALRVAVVLAALAATALTHGSAFGMALIATVPPLVPIFVSTLWPALGTAWRDRSSLTRLGALALVAVLALVALGWLFTHFSPGTTSALPGLLSSVFSHSWDMSAPALHATGGAPLRFQYEALLAGVLGLGAVLLVARARRSEMLIALGPALVAVFAALPCLDVSDPQGLAFRLRISAFIPLALTAAVLARWLLARVSPATGTLVAISFALAFAWARPGLDGEGVVEVHPAMQAGVRALAGVLPDDPHGPGGDAGPVLVVPERHLMFMATWYTGYPARLRPEGIAPERRWRLVPMAYMSEKMTSAIDFARTRSPASLVPPRGLHPGHRNGLVVMPEPTWRWLVEQISRDDTRQVRDEPAP